MHEVNDWTDDTSEQIDDRLKRVQDERDCLALKQVNDHLEAAQLAESTLSATQELITKECNGVKRLLLAKNKKYGNSASNPRRIFAKGTPLDQIAVRCDDKLSRIDNMGGLAKVIADAKNAEEDTVLDLIGYLILARVVHREQSDT